MYIKSIVLIYLYYTYVYYLSKSLPCFSQYLTASQQISQPLRPTLPATAVTHLLQAGTFHQPAGTRCCSAAPSRTPASIPSLRSVLRGLGCGLARQLPGSFPKGPWWHWSQASHRCRVRPWDLDVLGLRSSCRLLLELRLPDTPVLHQASRTRGPLPHRSPTPGVSEQRAVMDWGLCEGPRGSFGLHPMDAS